MTQVRLLTGAVLHCMTYDAGMVINLPDDEAERYIASGFAVAAVPSAIEVAAIEPATERADITYSNKRVKNARVPTART